MVSPPRPHPCPPQLGHVQCVSPVTGAGNTEQLMQEISFHIHLLFLPKENKFLKPSFSPCLP